MSDNLIGATTAIFIVSLSIAVNEPVDVAWSTRDGTAKAGTDYKAANGVVSFLPGETRKQIEVTVYGQNVSPTGDKNFFINLTPPTNAVLGTALIEAVIKVEDESGVPVTSVIVAQGKRGLKGDPGLSAYEQAVIMGYTGTVEEWMQEQADAAAAAQRAGDFAMNALAAAVKAENAATAASFLGNIFPTPEAGVDPVTGVSNGAYYNVRSIEDDSFLVEYQNIGGVPTPSGKSYPSSSYLHKIASRIEELSEFVAQPFIADKSYALFDRVRLDNGDIVISTTDNNTSNPNDGLYDKWINPKKEQDRINELRFPVFSVKAFGAKGDGVTDDRVAIQAAIDACINNGGGTVYFPSTGDDYIGDAGDYSKFYAVKSTHADYPNSGLVVNLQGSRYVRGNITFFGAGYNSRVELHTSNNIDYLMNIPFKTNYMNFDQFYLEANKKAKNALYMADEFHPFLTMLASTFRGGSEYAAKISTYVATLTNSIFTGSTSGVRFAAPESLPSAPVTTLTLNSCYASGNTNIGFDFGYLTYCTLNSCACDDGLIAYKFGIALGVTMNGCGTERTVKAIEVEGYRGFTINSFFMLNSGSSDSANPQPYLIEFKAGTDATISGIRYEGSSRHYTYKLAVTASSYGSENITVTDRSVRRNEIYFVENYAFARPIKLLRDDQTEKNRTYSFSNVVDFVNHINLYGKDFAVNHVTTLNLSAGTYVLPGELNISNLDGKGELIIQGVAGDRSAVKIDTSALRLLLTNCSVKVRLKDLTLISTTSNTSARRLRVTNCPNVVLDNVHIDRNGVNTGYGVSAESGSLVRLINGTEATGPFATGAFVAADTSKFVMERRATAPTTGTWTAGMSFEYITPTTHRGAFYNGTAWTDYV